MNNTEFRITDIFNITLISKSDKRLQYIMKKDPILCNYVNQKNKIEYFLAKDAKQFFVYTIIGQLISTNVANKIYHRFSKMCNKDFSPKSILRFSLEDLRNLGMTYKKADYILSFMKMINKNKTYFKKISNMSNDNDAMKELMKLNGVGKWTAKMMLLACFDRQDIVLVEDLAFFNGYNDLYGCKKTPAQILNDCKKWSPYSSMGTRCVYSYAEEVYKAKKKNNK